MPAAPQRSFASGEITPDIHARVDLVRYSTGLKTCRNTIIRGHGGSSNRSGFSFIGEVKNPTLAVRLIPVELSPTNNYVLEFGNLYFRIIQNGAYFMEGKETVVTGVSAASPAVVTYSGGDTWTAGDIIELDDFSGSIGPYLNGRTLKIGTVDTGLNTFQLLNLDGTNFSTSTYPAYSSSGGSLNVVREYVTKFATADLPNLTFCVRDGILYVACSGKETHVIDLSLVPASNPVSYRSDLSRTQAELDGGDVAWLDLTMTLTAASAASPTNYQYALTATNPATGEESLMTQCGAEAEVSTIAVAGAVVTITTNAAHGFTAGNWVRFYNDPSNNGNMPSSALLARDWRIASTPTATTFTIRASGISAIAGGDIGLCAQVSRIVASDTLSASNTVTMNWTLSGNLDNYIFNVYRAINGVFGLIGTATSPVSGSATASFIDTGYTPNTAIRPPVHRYPFVGTSNAPAAIGILQQRFVCAGSSNNPELVDMSQPGGYMNYCISDPVVDSDAVTFTMASSKSGAVKHILDHNKRLIFTETAEVALEGNDAGVITPASINPKVLATNGIGTLRPLPVNDSVLYVQAQGNVIRDLFFDTNGKSNDVSLFSQHLVIGYQIVDWAFQKIPDSIVWMVRNDGVLIGMTYMREQEIIAWHRHDSDGKFENVVSIPENGQDVVYVVVKRTINGSSKRYVERLNPRTSKQTRYRFAVSSSTYAATVEQKPVSDIADLVFMDSALTYDGRINKTAYEANSSATLTRMTLTTGAGWTTADTLTLTASAATFTSAAYDVGNAVIFYDADGLCLGRFTIAGFTSTTVVTGTFSLTVPTALRATPTYEWHYAVDSVSGLWHLEGETVSVIADGFVIGSPNNSSVGTTYTVTNGQLTLDQPYGVIHVGMPFVSDLQTLNIDADGTALLGKQKTANQIEIYLKESRGVWVGPRDPADDPNNTSDALLWNLVELRQRSNENYYEPVAPFTGTERVNILAEWNSNGRIFIRQVDPLPISVLAVLTDCQVSVPRG